MDIKKKTKMVMNVLTLIYNLPISIKHMIITVFQKQTFFMNNFPVIDFFNLLYLHLALIMLKFSFYFAQCFGKRMIQFSSLWI